MGIINQNYVLTGRLDFNLFNYNFKNYITKIIYNLTIIYGVIVGHKILWKELHNTVEALI